MGMREEGGLRMQNLCTQTGTRNFLLINFFVHHLRSEVQVKG